MKVTCRYEIPKEAYEHTNGDIGEHVGNMIVRKLCEKIADIVANGGEYIFRMTPNDIMENPYTNSMHYQRYVLYEPLIRCKDCKHRSTDECPMYWMEWLIIDEGDVYTDNDFIVHDYTTDEGYCNFGEKAVRINDQV